MKHILALLSCTLFACQAAVADEHGVLSAVALAEQNGRVLVMYVTPQQPDLMLAGTTHGGLWLSSDGGNQWHPASSDMQQLAVTAIVSEPYHPQIIYAGTGDGRSGKTSAGHGLYKSNDGGQHWQQLPLTDPQQVGERWNHVLSIAVSTDGIVLAATSDNKRNGYIFRSNDGGNSWGLFPVYDGSAVGKHNLVHKVRFDPADPQSAIFMDDYANVTYSNDAGISWSVVRKSSGTCK